MKTSPGTAVAFGRWWLAFAVLLLAAVSAARAETVGGWANADIGAVAAAGSAAESDGVVTVTGSGEDIGGSADEFHFRYVAWRGDGIFIARVPALTHTHEWAKAGVMIRSSLAPESFHVFACANARGIASALWRDSGGSFAASALETEEIGLPKWLRLRRRGDTIVADWSPDGLGWHRLATLSGQGMPAVVQVGLAVTSRTDGALCTATFDHIRLEEMSPAPLTAVVRGARIVELAWRENLFDATGYDVERSTAGGPFTWIWGGESSEHLMWDATVASSTTYHYRVRARAASGASLWSNLAALTTPPPPPTGWDYYDLGQTATSGRSTQSGGVFTLRGSGAGIGGVDLHHASQFKGDMSYHVTGHADELQFMTRSWTGDGEIVARLAGSDGPAGRQAGIMIRADQYVPHGRNVFLGRLPDGTIGLTARVGIHTTETGTERYFVAPDPTLPVWLKLARSGGGVMGYTSSDGATWQDLGWITLTLPAETHVGLALSSHEDGVDASATFDGVVVRPVSAAISPPPAPTNFALEGHDGSVWLTWLGTWPANYERIELERSENGGAFQLWREFTAQMGYNDFEVTIGSTYSYRARSVRGGAYSAFTPTLTVVAARTPRAATNLIATVRSPNQIDLEWTDNADNETAYSLERGAHIENSWTTVSTPLPANTRRYSDTTVMAGTTYHYYVIASNSGGSANSLTTSATTPPLSPTGGPTITAQPTHQVASPGGSAVFRVATAAANPTYQWRFNGRPIPHVTGDTLQVNDVGPAQTGIYDVVVTEGTASLSVPATLGLMIADATKVMGNGVEVGSDVQHPNGNVYDQVLMNGPAVAVRADPGQVTRVSFVDLNDDIVQVEFSGRGTLSIALDGAGAPAPARSYDQPGINYVQGHAGITLAGADASTHLAVFSVGRATAVNQSLFRDGVTYDAVADVAFVALHSNGAFGGARPGNTSFFALRGYTGLYAREAGFTLPIYVGDIDAFDDATPLLMILSSPDTRVTGGDFAQTNGRPVQVSGLEKLYFTDGMRSDHRPLPAQPIRGRLVEEGADVTSDVAVNPN